MVIRADEMTTDVRVHMRDGAGEALLTGLCPALPAKMRLFSKITLKKGCGIGYHEHHGETELFAFVSGQGRVQDDDAWVDVKAGDSMATPDGHGHAVENTGEEDLVFIAAIVKD